MDGIPVINCNTIKFHTDKFMSNHGTQSFSSSGKRYYYLLRFTSLIKNKSQRTKTQHRLLLVTVTNSDYISTDRFQQVMIFRHNALNFSQLDVNRINMQHTSTNTTLLLINHSNHLPFDRSSRCSFQGSNKLFQCCVGQPNSRFCCMNPILNNNNAHTCINSKKRLKSDRLYLQAIKFLSLSLHSIDIAQCHSSSFLQQVKLKIMLKEFTRKVFLNAKDRSHVKRNEYIINTPNRSQQATVVRPNQERVADLLRKNETLEQLQCQSALLVSDKTAAFAMPALPHCTPHNTSNTTSRKQNTAEQQSYEIASLACTKKRLIQSTTVYV